MLKAEEEERLRLEEEARLKAEEEERLRLEEEERLKAEKEVRLRLEEEARLKAEEEERLRLEEEARLQAEEEERRRLEREARLKAEEEERRRLEEEVRKKAEEARLKAEEDARIRAEEEAKQRAIEEAKRKVAEEEAIARRIAEAERRIAEQEKLREIKRLERLKQEEEERRLAEIKRKQYEEHLEKYEQLITVEAEKIAGTQPPAFFGGRKFEQIENIKLFLRTKLSLDQFMQKPSSFDSLMKAIKCDQLSSEVKELFPRINIASFLTISAQTLEKSDNSQENNHLKSVLHVDAQNVDTEENFNLIADLIDRKKQVDSSVAIVCEQGPQLAATLSLTHPIKYDGYKTSKAAAVVLKKRPGTELDERLLARLRTWEWSVRRERLIRRSVEVAASQLPLVSVMALFWLGIRLLQEKVEREHRREQEGGDYEYFDIIRWP